MRSGRFTDPKHPVLGVDAGGTSTRAVLVARDGTCLGYGEGPSGNPTSAGAEAAAAAIALAASGALAAGRREDPAPPLLVAAMAGAGLRDAAWLTAALAASGLAVEAELEADLTALYLSGTLAMPGTALILGTGAIAARVDDYRIDRVADGLGWLLGDAGSGFWLGRRAARRVAAELDGRAGPTAMTAPVLAALGIVAAEPESESEPETGGQDDIAAPGAAVRRPADLAALLHAVYARRPVELAALAPAVFAAADAGDAAAAGVLAEAATRAAEALLAVGAGEGPVVLGGGVLAAQPALAAAVRDRLAAGGAGRITTIAVQDGVVGAAVLALRRAGAVVDDTVHARIVASLAVLRDRARRD